MMRRRDSNALTTGNQSHSAVPKVGATKHTAGCPFLCTANRNFVAASGRQARSFHHARENFLNYIPFNYSEGKSNTPPGTTASLLLVAHG